jgi:ATP-dependent Clp protease ATP-binding subunit ClpA
MGGYSFTDELRRTLFKAKKAATSLRHEYVGTEHLLLGMLAVPDATGNQVLRMVGVEPERVAEKLLQTVKPGRTAQPPFFGPELPYTSRAKKVLELAMSGAKRLNDNYVGSEHLLLGLLSEAKGIAAQVLVDSGVSLTNPRVANLTIIHRGSRQEAGGETLETSSVSEPPDVLWAGRSSGALESVNPRASGAFNFTERVRRVLGEARNMAAALGHPYVGTEHELLALLSDDGIGSTVLQNLGLDLSQASEAVRRALKPGMDERELEVRDLPYTVGAKQVLEHAMREARELNHSYVGTEHILLGLLREQRGIAAQVLHSFRVTVETARAETLRILGTNMPAALPAPPTGETAVRVAVVLQYSNGATVTKGFSSPAEAASFLSAQ